MGIFKNFPNISVNFSEAIGTPLYNEEGLKIGKLNDIFVDYEDVYPLVIALQYTRSQQSFYIEWENIIEFSYKKIIIKTGSFEGRSRTYPKSKDDPYIHRPGTSNVKAQEYPPLGKIILDRQIVDTAGKKVVRVNDIQLIKAGRFLRVTHAAIGLRSMIRRLGFEVIVDTAVKVCRPKSKYLTREVLINWKYVNAIPNKNIQSSLKLNLSNEDVKDLHPADLADILEDLDSHGRELIFSNLDPKMAAETLSELEDDFQANLLKNESPEKAAKIIENMDTDDAADVLSDLGETRASAIIANIEDDEIQEDIQELLEYEEDTAGGLMSTEVFEITEEMTQKIILEKIAKEHEDLETIYDLYIIDNSNRLMGTCSLRDILIRRPDLQIKEYMNSEDMKTLPPDTPWKEVASFMSKYNLINVPIINNERELLGIVSVDDLLPWLLHE